MLITKEKITFLIAIIVAVFSLALSVSEFSIPDAVPEPAEIEKARPVNLGEELIPAISAKRILKPDEGRNPFKRAENYSEQAPVPLSLPPALGLPNLLPSSQVRFGLSNTLARDFKASALDPENSVVELSDKLPEAGSGDPGDDQSDKNGDAGSTDEEGK